MSSPTQKSFLIPAKSKSSKRKSKSKKSFSYGTIPPTDNILPLHNVSGSVPIVSSFKRQNESNTNETHGGGNVLSHRTHSGGTSFTNGYSAVSQGFAQSEDNLSDRNSNYEFEDSHPSSSSDDSDDSSLDDVCLPIDFDDSNDEAEKMWPDLSVLEEFHKEELLEALSEAEYTETSANNMSTSVNSSFGGNQVNFQYPIVSKVDSVMSKKINETEEIKGRLRPPRFSPWDQKNVSKTLKNYLPNKFQQFRYSYFRPNLESTIHSSTITGLLQDGLTFADLFSTKKFSSSDSIRKKVPQSIIKHFGDNLTVNLGVNSTNSTTSSVHVKDAGATHSDSSSTATGAAVANANASMPQPQIASHKLPQTATGTATPVPTTPGSHTADPDPIPFWLDVLDPTEEEMKVLSKAFGIHPLTTEDIFLNEAREKVELFKDYYFVCFRSFDIVQERLKRKALNERLINETDAVRKKLKNKYKELEPLNFYIIVFHHGVLTFHFSPTPHPVTVRRRARLLKDYLTVSSDWIAYALIDDITDAFGPMIETIEDEVYSFEDTILKLHSGYNNSDDSDSEFEDELSDDNKSLLSSKSSRSSRSSRSRSSGYSYSSIFSAKTTSSAEWQRKGDMLRKIGECRKKIMSLLRLLGSKADVIKGLTKRCNENFDVAPRSEIGMYLGDISDHIITMVQSLNHYEKLLARSHSNYLAQINIDMTKVNNDMNDVLGKITVLGTIVLPMNVITGLWGMNVIVPGQEAEGLVWFFGILLSMILIAITSYYVTVKIYNF